jgi:PAS domain S-box-containing protein
VCVPLDEALRQLRAREAELARVQRIGQIGGLEVDLRGGQFRNRRSPEYLAVHGLPPEAATESHEDWVARIHPQDRERVVSHFQNTVFGRERDYEVEYRIIRPSDGEVRWILAKAEIERDVDGRPLRLVGAHIDITARRSAEEQRELIARELKHRIANIFTVISSLVTMSARSEPGAARFAEEVVGRLGALHRAHSLVLDKIGSEEGDTLRSLLTRLVSPYVGDRNERIVVEGDDGAVGRSASTAIALVVHELATNAVKYGALSVPEGSVRIEVMSTPEQTSLRWVERGGPAVASAPTRQGFGSVLVERAARAQLAANLTQSWEPSGLSFLLEMPTARLGA